MKLDTSKVYYAEVCGPQKLRAGSEMARRRARIQRISDSAFMSGWVVSSAGLFVKVFCNGCTTLAKGDLLAVEAFGVRCTVHFRAKVLDLGRNIVLLELQGRKTYIEPAAEEPRTLVGALSVEISSGDRIVRGHLVDASLLGAGVIVPVSFDRDSIVTVSSESMQLGNLEGSVRYCRQIESGLGPFRIGVRLNAGERLTWGRWHSIVFPEAEAA